MSRKLGVFAGVTVCVLLVVSVAMAGQDADVAGDWTLNFTIPMGEGRTIAGTLTFEVDGQDLTGTFLREGGDTPSELTGKIDGSAISFMMTGMGGRPGGGGGGRPPGGGGGGRGAMQVTFEGTVDGDAMSGEFDLAGRASGDWTAKRAS